ncbi:MAG TPA: ATP-binding cassette domain-containing protein [Leptospiraceae bacterium]|nr:ABC transporter ATP-binding protein [Leptospirales bacterium]HMU85258.1 ATP-binding cassette domain-containing protein [Leptospiraceae bacterium]HMX57635.1 ATP-binding cassette domain-containing protein [Leptospiraceae bacterium]HMY46841.1 ATP-binding cassette domain-containing protein [Leptospiraceae bacterium]HMZ37351.1 ATP-binding cassette domain-containing protein [Leptospiraceae bacterium]
MIEVKEVSRTFGDFTAVQGVSFNVDRKAGITGLLGPNGAGKTTTMRMITGYLRPSSGDILIDGESVRDEENLTGIKRRIGYLPETTPLYPEMLVSEFLKFMGEVRGVHGAELDASAVQMVDRLDLGSHLYSPIGILSKGFRQRVALAGTLIHKPEVIILDEPTSGLDPNQISEIRSLIVELGKTATVILSTHILQEVEELCNRVIIINRGRVVADETTAVLKSVQACSVVARGEDVEKKLASIPIVTSVIAGQNHKDGFRQYLCEVGENGPEKLFAELAGKSLEVREFAPVARSLQSVFEELTN